MNSISSVIPPFTRVVKITIKKKTKITNLKKKRITERLNCPLRKNMISCSLLEEMLTLC